MWTFTTEHGHARHTKERRKLPAFSFPLFLVIVAAIGAVRTVGTVLGRIFIAVLVLLRFVLSVTRFVFLLVCVILRHMHTS